MPGRDWPSVQRDMDTALKTAVWQFQQHKIPIETVPITQVALAMFKSYREPTAEDMVEKALGGMMELFLLYVDRCYEKEDS